jgi:hypothetical protein
VHQFKDKLKEVVTSRSLHKDFKLIIITRPFNGINDIVPTIDRIWLEDEPDLSFKESMIKAYKTVKQDQFDHWKKDHRFRGILFGLCAYQAIFMGRLKHVPQGWNYNYSPNFSSIKTAVGFVEKLLKRTKGDNCDELKYIVGNIIYGGQLNSSWDQRLNATFVSHIFRGDFLMKPQKKFLPKFKSLDPKKFDNHEYLEHITCNAPDDIPKIYGITYDRCEGIHYINQTYYQISTYITQFNRKQNERLLCRSIILIS